MNYIIFLKFGRLGPFASAAMQSKKMLRAEQRKDEFYINLKASESQKTLKMKEMYCFHYNPGM